MGEREGVVMATMWQLDVQVYQLYNRRLQQLKSYRGTPDELTGDDQRIAETRRRMDRHFVEMCLYQLDRAHDEVAKYDSKQA